MLDQEEWRADGNNKSSGPASATTSPIPPAVPNPDPDDLVPSDDEIVTQRNLIRNLKQMEISSNQHMRFFGKSSNIAFIQSAIEAKYQYEGLDLRTTSGQGWRPLLPSRRPQFWGTHPVGDNVG